jgi:DNA helicase IV
VSTGTTFSELPAERARLAFARTARDRMIDRLERVDPDATADDFTKEYVEVTVAEALESLRSPGAGDFFGRIDERRRGGGVDQWYIGRRHIEDDAHDPVVVDWRAPISAPFYRATAVDPLGMSFRRRFTLDDGELIAYLDEDLDDPTAGDVASGVPDPVLAEIGAARSGAMREIVATIQAEQDVVIRSPIDQTLIVQGGPGTGKTAVALHRAAYLLFEHRGRLARDGVLVVGPNRAFLDYIANVLPSLGERAVRQCTALDLCLPKVEIGGLDDLPAARWKGSPDRLDDLLAAALAAIVPPDDDVAIPIGARTVVFTRGEVATWLDIAKQGIVPINQRRERLRVLARQALLRRTESEEAWSQAAPLKSVLNKAWPTQQPVRLVDRMLPGPNGKRRMWTAADQFLVDEANTLLNGTPFTYGHVIVDEAQDHSAVALRVIGRRSPSGSMTLVGDVAQSTTPAGQESWRDVFAHLAVRGAGRGAAGRGAAGRGAAGRGAASGSVALLTIGYRVPEPILEIANRLLPLTGVEAVASRSVRGDGGPPAWHSVSPDEFAMSTAAIVGQVKHRHRLTGVVAPPGDHEAITAGLAAAGLITVDHVHQLAADEVPLFGPEEVKGLEFDGVVVVNPHTILGDDTRGARLLYVAMTRAVQELAFVTTAPPPPVLSA